MIHRYPRRMIPKPQYGIIKESFFNSRMKDFFLLRRIKYKDDGLGFQEKIKSQFLPSTFKNGISVVLYTICRKEDICWCCRKPYGKKKKYELAWVKNNRTAVFPRNKHLQYEKRASFGGYRIKDLYEYEAEFPVQVKDKQGNTVERKDIIRLKVIHEPVCINFWHCEIMLYRINGKDKNVNELSNNEMARAGNLIIDDLADMAYLPEDTETMYLERKYYKKRCLAE